MRMSDWSSDVCSSDLRGGLASSPAGRSVRLVRAGRGDLLQQQLVDARTVEVDDLDPPAAPLDMLTDVGDTAELGDDHARGGVVFVLVLQRQPAGAEHFDTVAYRTAAFTKPRAVNPTTHHPPQVPPPPL